MINVKEMSRSPLSMLGNQEGGTKYSKVTSVNGQRNHSGDMGYAEMMEATSMEAPYSGKSTLSYSAAEKDGPHVHSKNLSQNVSHNNGYVHEDHHVSEEYKNNSANYHHHHHNQNENMEHRHHEQKRETKGGMGGSVCALFVWFLIIFILSWLVLFALKPQFVLKPDSEELDTGKTLLAAAVISLIIIIIIWLIKGCTSRSW